MTRADRRAGTIVTVLAAGAIALLTLWPQPELAPMSAATPVWCIVCGSQGVSDVILNILLFVPFGAGLGVAGVRTRTAMLVAVAATFTIELLQLEVVAGRDASVSDLLTNTLGAATGLWLGRRWRGIVLPAPAAARRLAMLWSALVVVVATLTAAAVAPSMPAPPYWGQWTPELGGFVQHPGRVTAATVDAIPVPHGRLRASDVLADSLADGELRVNVTAEAGPPTRGLAPLFRVVDGHGNQALLVAQLGRDLYVETGTRAERLRIGAVSLLVPDAITARGATAITAESDRRGYRVTVSGPAGNARVHTVSRSVTWGWAILLPFVDRIDGRRRLLDALWMAGLMLPLGWWAARGLGPGPGALLGGGALGAALAAVPAAAGLTPAGLAAWAGGAAGFVVGAAGWRTARRGR
jgi:hypothetical protein